MTDEPLNKVSRWNKHALIAILLGTILIIISHSEYAHDNFHEAFQVAAHEVGFALIVASVIWYAFEFFAQNETEEIWVKRIERVSRNVFLGVFGKNLPRALIDEATLLIIYAEFVRYNTVMTYTFTDIQVTSPAGEKNYVRIDSTAQFVMKNISSKQATYQVKMALPNPLLDELKPICKVSNVTIKVDGREVEIDNSERTKAETEFRKDLSDNNKHDAMYHVKDIIIDPNRDAEIILHYTIVKEEEDTEIFHAGYPMDGVRVNIFDAPNKRIIRARSIHRCSLDNHTFDLAHGTYSFVLNKYIIPNQGYCIYWKKRPPKSPAAEQSGLHGS